MIIKNDIEYYDSGEVIKLLNITHTRLQQLRSGYTSKKNNKTYSNKPKFTENEDYIWERGRSYYKKSVIDEMRK